MHAISDSQILIVGGLTISGAFSQDVLLLDIYENQLTKHGEVQYEHSFVRTRSCYSNGKIWMLKSTGEAELYDFQEAKSKSIEGLTFKLKGTLMYR